MTKTKLGETIMCDGMMGTIVADIDNDCYSNDYPKSDWGYLQTGFLIETQEFGLIHYHNQSNVGINMIVFNYYGKNEEDTELFIESLNGYDLSNLHLHRLSYNDKYKYSFNDTYSKNAKFFNTILRSVIFNHCIFELCDFNKTKFYAGISRRVLIKNSSFNNSSLRASFYESSFKECHFVNSDFFSYLKNVWFEDNKFLDCYFEKTEFIECIFEKCTFKNCIFENCEFINCSIYENIDTNNQFIKCENPFVKVEMQMSLFN